jgi:hypothetical protein
VIYNTYTHINHVGPEQPAKRLLWHRCKRSRYVPFQILCIYPLALFFLPTSTAVLGNVRKQANSTGNTLGAATNTVGKGVQGVTDATGNVVAAGGKGLGDAVTGVTQGVGDTTKGTFTSRVWVVGGV